MTLTEGPRIDSHLHLWDIDAGEYAWLTPEHGPLHATFTAEQAKLELDAAGIDSAVLVQAEDSLRDTESMLAIATAHPWVAGVVGWVPLDDPEATERALEQWAQHPAFCGIRHLIHDDPRPDFLLQPAIRDSLALVAGAGVAFDVPDAWPTILGQAVEVAEAIPALTVVIDHLAKPPLGFVASGPEGFTAWRKTFARAARLPNVVAKVSGLTVPAVPFTADALRPAWDAALESFGPSRLMYGGDWPITVRAGGYQAAWSVYAELIGELSSLEQSELLHSTAMKAYRLQPSERKLEEGA